MTEFLNDAKVPPCQDCGHPGEIYEPWDPSCVGFGETPYDHPLILLCRRCLETRQQGGGGRMSRLSKFLKAVEAVKAERPESCHVGSRCLARFSDMGDLVLSDFGGLATVALSPSHIEGFLRWCADLVREPSPPSPREAQLTTSLLDLVARPDATLQAGRTPILLVSEHGDFYEVEDLWKGGFRNVVEREGKPSGNRSMVDAILQALDRWEGQSKASGADAP